MESKKNAFNDFCRTYQVLSEREKEFFSKVSNRLLSKTFIQKAKKEDLLYYSFCVEHYEVIRAYFAITDYNVDFYTQDMLFQLKNENDRNRFRLKKIDTVILLLLRQIYTEKSKEASISSEIYATVNELHEALRTKNLVNDRVKKTDLQNSLRTLKKYSIIEYNVSKVFDDDSTIRIYPSIVYVVNINDINTLKKRLEKYVDRKDNDEEINED